MPANIQVILQQDIDKLGKSGELVRVRPGFARNFLLPRQLAVPATSSAVKRIEHEKLFGSVTAKDLETAAKAAGLAIDRKALKLAEPIKNVGSYEVPVKLVS